MEKITVHLGERSYPIYIGAGILRQAGELCRSMGLSPRGAMITNPTVGQLYTESILTSFMENGFALTVLEVPDGEEYKSLEWVGHLYRKLLPLGLDRRSPVIAFGGGVIGDLAGFVAATFMRGLPYIQIPTSLLAQVDSSVGGKVAVNLPEAKNMIGAFYQPRLVVSDVRFLQTLPPREFQAGLAEVVKYGVIADKAFFEWLEGSLVSILRQEEETLMHLVRTSCQIKARVVEVDERDEGPRAMLNFGHTVGHAIEAATGYGQYTHGEAIAIGMVVAAQLSHHLGLCSKEVPHRIVALLRRIGLPTQLPIKPGKLLKSIAYDKKVKNGMTHFVLTKDLGSVTVTPIFDLREALQAAGKTE
jgi:3-dehydroquinate synthase